MPGDSYFSRYQQNHCQQRTVRDRVNPEPLKRVLYLACEGALTTMQIDYNLSLHQSAADCQPDLKFALKIQTFAEGSRRLGFPVQSSVSIFDTNLNEKVKLVTYLESTSKLKDRKSSLPVQGRKGFQYSQ